MHLKVAYFKVLIKTTHVFFDWFPYFIGVRVIRMWYSRVVFIKLSSKMMQKSHQVSASYADPTYD